MQNNGFRRKRRIWLTIFILAAIILSLWSWFRISININPPAVADRSSDTLKVIKLTDEMSRCGQSWLKKDSSGLWLMYLKGSPYQCGLTNGRLARNLIYTQEKAFISQIRKMIPSDFYLHFLRYFIYWFNRDLDTYVPLEYKQEIFGVSRSASDDFAFIGNNYQRMLNYHSAHDIGHALEQLSLVGCTSFAAWGNSSADGSLILGRNFDFYMGDEFARNKIVCFEQPDSGHAFMMVTWGGMIGAVSGMNEEGLTVTINAARSKIPLSARTPISLLAREILQYASTVYEAYAIAEKRHTFVSESLLIGSAKDGRAAIIEKSPFKTALLQPKGTTVLCTNHFQSADFAGDSLNQQNIRSGTSLYRMRRLREDMNLQAPLNVEKAAWILRDRAGLKGRDIGMGNEKAMNQLIAHHSVIFMPSRLLVWVSTGPWQLGAYKCFDLRKIFHNFAPSDQGMEIDETAKAIQPDIFLKSNGYKAFIEFRSMKRILFNCIKSGSKLTNESSFVSAFIHTNPGYYESWFLAAEYFYRMKKTALARSYYYKALQCEVPAMQEKQKIIRRIAECSARLKRNYSLNKDR
ncbi:MAG: C45 family autoproteolytic acyltransferase/hydrolase [Bacteroidetes bacterium]|nr:C45 family autoproteolytic acyltransferase/hydrolase [Bacteroidota bacterium]